MNTFRFEIRVRFKGKNNNDGNTCVLCALISPHRSHHHLMCMNVCDSMFAITFKLNAFRLAPNCRQTMNVIRQIIHRRNGVALFMFHVLFVEFVF